MRTRGLIRPHQTKLATIHKLLDAGLIVAGYSVCVQSPFVGWTELDMLSATLATGLFYEFAKVHDLYSSGRMATITQEALSIGVAWTYTVLVLVLLAGILDEFERFVPSDVWLCAVSVPVAITGWHMALRILLRHWRRRIIIGMEVPALLIALCVKLTSPGPVPFTQRRYGLDGREIRIVRFRTMTVTEDEDEIPQATPNDSCVTLIGRLLRRTSLDELPQFFNVLIGNMSIVGPQPHAVAHNEQYRKLVKSYMLQIIAPTGSIDATARG